jgi:(1->4)-alpha-D-glucan 1-alpha-D-glucosylmutase
MGALNSLAQLALKATIPGVPDFYQGTEFWDLSLVDPDNRRPVDFAARASALASIGEAPDWPALAGTWPDGRIKLFLTKHILQLRRRHANLFERGEYLPLHASGTFAECCVSFVRQLADNWIAVIAPRLSSRIGFPPIGEAWQDTAIQLPEAFSLKDAHDLFTRQAIHHAKRQVSVRDVLSVLPFAVITNLR